MGASSSALSRDSHPGKDALEAFCSEAPADEALLEELCAVPFDIIHTRQRAEEVDNIALPLCLKLMHSNVWTGNLRRLILVVVQKLQATNEASSSADIRSLSSGLFVTRVILCHLLSAASSSTIVTQIEGTDAAQIHQNHRPIPHHYPDSVHNASTTSPQQQQNESWGANQLPSKSRSSATPSSQTLLQEHAEEKGRVLRRHHKRILLTQHFIHSLIHYITTVPLVEATILSHTHVVSLLVVLLSGQLYSETLSSWPPMAQYLTSPQTAAALFRALYAILFDMQDADAKAESDDDILSGIADLFSLPFRAILQSREYAKTLQHAYAQLRARVRMLLVLMHFSFVPASQQMHRQGNLFSKLPSRCTDAARKPRFSASETILRQQSETAALHTTNTTLQLIGSQSMAHNEQPSLASPSHRLLLVEASQNGPSPSFVGNPSPASDTTNANGSGLPTDPNAYHRPSSRDPSPSSATRSLPASVQSNTPSPQLISSSELEEAKHVEVEMNDPAGDGNDSSSWFSWLFNAGSKPPQSQSQSPPHNSKERPTKVLEPAPDTVSATDLTRKQASLEEHKRHSLDMQPHQQQETSREHAAPLSPAANHSTDPDRKHQALPHNDLNDDVLNDITRSYRLKQQPQQSINGTEKATIADLPPLAEVSLSFEHLAEILLNSLDSEEGTMLAYIWLHSSNNFFQYVVSHQELLNFFILNVSRLLHNMSLRASQAHHLLTIVLALSRSAAIGPLLCNPVDEKFLKWFTDDGSENEPKLCNIIFSILLMRLSNNWRVDKDEHVHRLALASLINLAHFDISLDGNASRRLHRLLQHVARQYSRIHTDMSTSLHATPQEVEAVQESKLFVHVLMAILHTILKKSAAENIDLIYAFIADMNAITLIDQQSISPRFARDILAVLVYCQAGMLRGKNGKTVASSSKAMRENLAQAIAAIPTHDIFKYDPPALSFEYDGHSVTSSMQRQVLATAWAAVVQRSLLFSETRGYLFLEASNPE